MFVKVSTKDIKHFGLDKVKEFCVSNSAFDNMLKSFKELELENLFDQKKKIKMIITTFLVIFLSPDQFLKHSKSFDHYEKVLEHDLKESDLCFRKLCDSFARTEKEFCYELSYQ